MFRTTRTIYSQRFSTIFSRIVSKFCQHNRNSPASLRANEVQKRLHVKHVNIFRQIFHDKWLEYFRKTLYVSFARAEQSTRVQKFNLQMDATRFSTNLDDQLGETKHATRYCREFESLRTRKILSRASPILSRRLTAIRINLIFHRLFRCESAE